MQWSEPTSLRFVYNYKIQLLKVGDSQPFEIDLGGTLLQPIPKEYPAFVRKIDNTNFPNITSATQYRLRVSAIADVGAGAFSEYTPIADG